MISTLKKIIYPFYKRYHFWYHKKPRKYVYKNIFTIIQPSVFSPKNTISTKVFLDYINNLDLNNKTVLELGCGSGIIAILSASKGAKVIASDINKIALKSLKKVSKNQGFDIKCIYSDLFNEIPKTNNVVLKFNYIFINPPYYPKKPKNIEEQAWFCGANFEYFEKLFQQLIKYINQNYVFMILSENCNLIRINDIALKNNLILDCVFEKKMFAETNYIMKIRLK